MRQKEKEGSVIEKERESGIGRKRGEKSDREKTNLKEKRGIGNRRKVGWRSTVSQGVNCPKTRDVM
eukprot:1062404-Amorphochlora_amoeboformis.AAC.1